MKPALLLLWLVCYAPFVTAQQIDEEAVPVAVMDEFDLLYPDARSILWIITDAKYRAEFKNNKMATVAVLGPDGMLYRTETQIKVTALPEPALACLQEKYPDQHVEEATIIEDQSGIITFQAQIEKKDFTFDAGGVLQKSDVVVVTTKGRPE